MKPLRKERGFTHVELAMKSGSSKEGEMKTALVQYKGKAAGILKETDEGNVAENDYL